MRFDDAHRRITALLGPTNTGKTHRAIEHMLAHRSGMIGLPLRLLAREVYDKVVARRGVDAVALVTGEEKKIPDNPSFFICTVEAMPIDRPVAFLAVDEIQLAADRNRGHVFTDRLLNARGVLETMFLGSDTMAPLVRALVPHANIEQLPRLSKLSWAGTHRLPQLPRRSALVAFSAADVYRNAERLRGLHGGVAVVMGALSPRTRNAQVALYESGAVQHIVATDAIGMGLNMDIGQVSFASLRKFDGHKHRALSDSELAQIAGRAGRHTADGHFSTLRSCGPLDPQQIDALQTHSFPPVRQLWWRNSRLDFSTPKALLDSLRRKPPHASLRPARNEEDERALAILADADDLPMTSADDVALLWEVCRIPDYRKTMTGSHVDLLHTLARDLLVDGCISQDRIGKRLDQLDRPEGDLETLMARIAYVRTWTFVAHHRAWFDDAAHWQERARAIEDGLSDALHERLRQRFVDAGSLVVRTDPHAALSVGDSGQVRLADVVVGHLRGLSWVPTTSERLVEKTARRKLGPMLARRVQALVGCADDEIAVDLGRRIWWRDGVLAELRRGPERLRPTLRFSRMEALEPGQRQAVRDRLSAWLATRTKLLLAPMGDGPAPKQDLARSVWSAVRMGLGMADGRVIGHTLQQLQHPDRRALKGHGVVVARDVAYSPDLLTATALHWRSILWSVWQDQPIRLIPGGSPETFPITADTPEDWLRAVSFRRRGTRAVRVDR
jgi:ATP-dependent RNA helicase SUPV3L1/SUV3